MLAGAATAATTDYPTKPIRYVVATGPGGASDIVARTIGPPLSELLGVQLVIDNRSGAGNTVGAELAARAAPDGYTLLSCNIASLAVGPGLYKGLGYDPERDFAVLGLIVSNPNIFTVNPSVPARTVPEFIALAKTQPGQFNYASGGIGTSPQLSMELFMTDTGIQIVHVPYKGVGPALLDLIAGRVQAMTSTVPAALSSVRSGKVRALAVTSKERESEMPDVPTVAESGVPGFEVVSWQGLCTNAGGARNRSQPPPRRARQNARTAGYAQATRRPGLPALRDVGRSGRRVCPRRAHPVGETREADGHRATVNGWAPGHGDRAPLSTRGP